MGSQYPVGLWMYYFDVRGVVGYPSKLTTATISRMVGSHDQRYITTYRAPFPGHASDRAILGLS